MVCTYDNYKDAVRALSLEECLRIHQEIASEVSGDPDAEELYDDLIEAAIDYAEVRAQWTIKPDSWKADHDNGRTIYHDSLIDAFNILARYLRTINKPASWRDELGTDKKGYDRKRVGDFGCFLAFVHGINGR